MKWIIAIIVIVVLFLLLSRSKSTVWHVSPLRTIKLPTVSGSEEEIPKMIAKAMEEPPTVVAESELPLIDGQEYSGDQVDLEPGFEGPVSIITSPSEPEFESKPVLEPGFEGPVSIITSPSEPEFESKPVNTGLDSPGAGPGAIGTGAQMSVAFEPKPHLFAPISSAADAHPGNEMDNPDIDVEPSDEDVQNLAHALVQDPEYNETANVISEVLSDTAEADPVILVEKIGCGRGVRATGIPAMQYYVGKYAPNDCALKAGWFPFIGMKGDECWAGAKAPEESECDGDHYVVYRNLHAEKFPRLTRKLLGCTSNLDGEYIGKMDGFHCMRAAKARGYPLFSLNNQGSGYGDCSGLQVAPGLDTCPTTSTRAGLYQVYEIFED